jgi:hypothetical protein
MSACNEIQQIGARNETNKKFAYFDARRRLDRCGLGTGGASTRLSKAAHQTRRALGAWWKR